MGYTRIALWGVSCSTQPLKQMVLANARYRRLGERALRLSQPGSAYVLTCLKPHSVLLNLL